ncbi:ABC transporter permease [Streptomyces sp. Ru73]|uniref:ABC transporter permease subunit n=1 Tax=Streptomyces sp. Ru73 TaxID=2080748 RepID=UPI000CDD8E6E|nr:ABC transporter permease subunit [Streptomyces sp. Ru73]POX41547.1 ABC transporter permease [Streptomyces sp. Ru73]
MTTLTGKNKTADTAAPAGRGGPLHGLPWLVWRRNRTAFLLLAALTVVVCGYCLYQRAGVVDFVTRYGNDTRYAEKFDEAYKPVFDRLYALSGLPGILGIFLGAPLIAGEQEHGTVRLATTQSVARTRWIAATVLLPLLAVLVSTTLISLAFTALWSPANRLVNYGDWLGGTIFDITGPVPVAMALFLTALGIAVGMLVRRVVPAMVLTFVGAFGTSVVWDWIRVRLTDPRTATGPATRDFPHIPDTAINYDQWLGTSDGRLLGWGTCVDAKKEAVCLADKGVVHKIVEYFDLDQMAGMQWRGSALLLVLTALVVAFTVLWTRRRPL